ncbi:MAG TPA: hypothetical protein VFZ23_17695 [Pyrinomonadaceae bacterium]
MRIKLSRGIWKGVLLAIFVAGVLADPVEAAETVETFETGTNQAGWTWGTGSEDILENDGNPGRYLRENYLVTFTPRASTDFGVQSIFTGDYQARNVASVGIDMAIPYVSGSVAGRRVTLILLNDNGTPDDLEDDWGAFTVTNLPIPPTGIAGIVEPAEILQWSSYDIDVPSQSATLPEGWSWISRNYLRRNGSWARLMRDVDHVGFIMGDPRVIYPLLAWDVALDNPRITTTDMR